MADDVILTENEITETLKELPGWEAKDGWLRRKYKTPGWAHTMMLTNMIGYVAEAANHHPDLEIGYAQVIFKIQTHRVRAITESDAALAKKIHEAVTWLPSEESPLSGFPKKWIE
ncbi:4a-hydroxytetrahydrobiopterin dehydratase [Thalassoglobus polymorphus]|uniref:4a-hydroxytetrahydrobiopterin dehydratase n=1 Tax=Thalassoglobus polymorphus TaxID=2527994 RepID=A0A517QNR3_9PLAN|nr:4a-hydroxytetrahydrobiopterin dehydratase [Thalassoglobus polymorphus]QDT33244.1 Putative pterin-4-alpha-carbinolamine dehydratase [Thalassoglobus polymorphus]